MLFEKKGLIGELLAQKSKVAQEEVIMGQVRDILVRDSTIRAAIKENLQDGSGQDFNEFDFDLMETGKIFHLDQIRAVCVDYRLRFLDSTLFKNPIPEEAISEIRRLQESHGTELKGFKIMAPSKTFYLKNYDDPLLFAPIGNGYYYLIHQWGNDLSRFRKMLVRPVRDFGSFLIFLAIVSLLLTALVPDYFAGSLSKQTFNLLIYFFIFKSVCGVALYYCFWRGKNFNAYIWDSPYYNK